MWFFSHGDNYKKFNKMDNKEKLQEIRLILIDPQRLRSEIEPIFKKFDIDGSGFLEFKEYKIAR